MGYERRIQDVSHVYIGGRAHTIYTSPPMRPRPGERLLRPAFSGGWRVWPPYQPARAAMARTRAVTPWCVRMQARQKRGRAPSGAAGLGTPGLAIKGPGVLLQHRRKETTP